MPLPWGTEICVAFRRSEFAAIDRENCLFNEEGSSVRVLVPEWASKVKEVQLGIIGDTKVVQMFLNLSKANTQARCFTRIGTNACQTRRYIDPLPERA